MEVRVLLFVVRAVFWGIIIVELRMMGSVVEMKVVLFVLRVMSWGVVIVELRIIRSEVV